MSKIVVFISISKTNIVRVFLTDAEIATVFFLKVIIMYPLTFGLFQCIFDTDCNEGRGFCVQGVCQSKLCRR